MGTCSTSGLTRRGVLHEPGMAGGCLAVRLGRVLTQGPIRFLGHCIHVHMHLRVHLHGHIHLHKHLHVDLDPPFFLDLPLHIHFCLHEYMDLHRRGHTDLHLCVLMVYAFIDGLGQLHTHIRREIHIDRYLHLCRYFLVHVHVCSVLQSNYI